MFKLLKMFVTVMESVIAHEFLLKLKMHLFHIFKYIIS